jgi:hypothetical protein
VATWIFLRAIDTLYLWHHLPIEWM